MATLTVYSDTSDGGLSSSNATYATARTGGTLAVENPGGTRADIGQLYSAAYFCYETFLSFDTSAIPDDATITSVTLYLHGATQSAIETAFTVEVRLYDWGSSLTTADWIAGENLGSQTLLASRSTAGWSTSAYNDFTSEAAFVNNVSKTGSTRLIVCSSRHRLGSAPSTGSSADTEYVRIVTAEQSGTTEDPKLVIEYNPAVTLEAAATITLTGTANLNMAAALSGAATVGVTATANLAISNIPTRLDFTRYDGYLNTLPVKYYDREPAVTETNQLRPGKQDVGNDPIEIRPESGDLFSMKDFSHGMGQSYFHVEGRDTKKFFASEGFDISEPDRLTHLNQMALVPNADVTTAGATAIIQVAGLPLVADATVVKRGNGSFPGTWTSETVGAVTIHDLAASGGDAYAGVNDTATPLYIRASGGTTWAAYQSGGTNITLGGGACTKLAWIKDRLMCVGGTASRSIYEVTGSTATPTAIRTLPAGWSFTDIWEGGRFIYAAAINTDKGLSKLYTFGLNSGATAIEEKASTNFPENTIIRCGTGYLDAILMGGGVHNSDGGYDPIYLYGQPDDNGLVQWVIVRQESGSGSSDLAVRIIRPHERSILIGWSLEATSDSLYEREGLAVHHLARDAFAHHLKVAEADTSPERVTGILVYKGRVLFTCNGLYYENIGTPVTQAELVSSVADWGNAGYKVWDTIEVAHDSLAASTSVTMDYATSHPEDVSTWAEAIVSDVDGATGKTAKLSSVKARRFVVRLRSNASGSSAPQVRSFSVRSNPAPDEAEWRLVRTVQLYGYDRKSGYGEPFFQNPDTLRDALMDMAFSWIRLTEEGITWNAWVDKVRLIEPDQAQPAGTLGQSRRNAYLLQLLMLATRD